jgi:hypothetical protein
MCIFIIQINVANTECNIKPNIIFILDFVFLWPKLGLGPGFLEIIPTNYLVIYG